jgi:hypothetical protein
MPCGRRDHYQKKFGASLPPRDLDLICAVVFQMQLEA